MDGSEGRCGVVVRWIWVWREGTRTFKPKALQDLEVLEGSSSDAKRAPRQSCLQHLQSQQKPPWKACHHRSSSPETLDYGSTKAPHCPTEMLLYPLPQYSYSCPTAQQCCPTPEAESRVLLISKAAQTTATQLRTRLAPLVSRAKPRDLRWQRAAVHPTKRNASRQALCACQRGSFRFVPQTRSDQTPRGACPHIDRPGRAQNLWPLLVKSGNVNRGMSRLVRSHQALTGAINLYVEGGMHKSAGERGRWRSLREGRGSGGLPFFGRTTGCRKQKINLSAWLSPATGLVLHKQ